MEKQKKKKQKSRKEKEQKSRRERKQKRKEAEAEAEEQKRATPHPPKESEQDSPAGFPLLLSPEMPLLSSGASPFFRVPLLPPRDASPFFRILTAFLRLTVSAAGVFTDAKSRNLSFADRKIIFLQNES